MWPFLSHALFPPPTEAWLQRASSDSEAQGWGAWSWTEKTSLAPGCGDRKEEETREAEDNEEDEEEASFPLSLLESEDLAEHPVADQVTALWNTAAWSIQWRLARNLRDPVHGGGGRGDRGRNTEF